MRHRRQLSTRRLPLVVFLAGLALVAVLSGYVLERYVLGSFVATKGKPASPAKEPVTTTTTKTEITVPAASLWRVQVGAFSSKDQANKLVSQLKAKGFGAYILGSDPYRVVAGVTKTKEAAQKLSDQLTRSGYKPYVAEFKQAAGSFSLTLDQAYVTVFRNGILSLADAVPAEASAWDSYYLGKKTDFVTSSTGVEATLANVAQKVTATGAPKTTEALHSALSALVQKALASAQDVRTFAEKGGQDLYVKATTSYLELIEAYDRFIAQMPK